MLNRDENAVHVVVLGAGATIASYPDGDSDGIKVPGMQNFLKKTGIYEHLKKDEIIDSCENLEDAYTRLYNNPEKDEIRIQLEHEIYSYLSKLKGSSIYNYYYTLLLALTNRDIVATFNWDPYLWQVYAEIYSHVTYDLPKLFFLHGNVAIGYCQKCNAFGSLYSSCKRCGNRYESIPLLFPTGNKDYNCSIYIRNAWQELNYSIAKADMITFYGYSAPESDYEARKMIKMAFDKSINKNLKQIDIINIEDEDTVMKKYMSIAEVNPAHICVYKSIFESSLAIYPRRSADYIRQVTLFLNPDVVEDADHNRIVFDHDDGFSSLIRKVNLIEQGFNDA